MNKKELSKYLEVLKESEQIDELSNKTLKAYAVAALLDTDKRLKKGKALAADPKVKKQQDKLDDYEGRGVYTKKGTLKFQKQIDKYKEGVAAAKSKLDPDWEKNTDINKRMTGVRAALLKMKSREVKEDTIDEGNKENKEKKNEYIANHAVSSIKKANGHGASFWKKETRNQMKKCTNEGIEDLLVSVIDSKPSTFQDVFNDILTSKISEKLDDIKSDLAVNLLNPVNESSEVKANNKFKKNLAQTKAGMEASLSPKTTGIDPKKHWVFHTDNAEENQRRAVKYWKQLGRKLARESENIDEISMKDWEDSKEDKAVDKKLGYKEGSKKDNAADKKMVDSINKAEKKLTKESEDLEEISKETLKSYINKAEKDWDSAGRLKYHGFGKAPTYDKERQGKRNRGLLNAYKKLAKESEE